MKFFRTKLVFSWLAAFWLLGEAMAWAHDPYQAYTDVTLRSNQMELNFSIGRFTTARLLLDNPAASLPPPPMLDEESFNRFLPKLKQVGKKIFEITACGTNLAPRAVDVQLNEEGDAVVFTIIYPRPATGPLRFAAAYIKLLPDDGYATTLSVFDKAHQLLAFADTLNMENMTFDFKSLPITKPSAQIVPSSMPHTKASKAIYPIQVWIRWQSFVTCLYQGSRLVNRCEFVCQNQEWRPYRESNPSYLREREVS